MRLTLHAFTQSAQELGSDVLVQPSPIAGAYRLHSPLPKLKKITTGNSPVWPQYRHGLSQPASTKAGAIHPAMICLTQTPLRSMRTTCYMRLPC